MAIETIKFGRDEFRVRSIMAFYCAKNSEGFHISAYTKLGTSRVCESASQEKIEEKLRAISGQLQMVGLNNFALTGDAILNIEEVKYVDLEHTPFLSSMLSKQVVATFRDDTKLTIGSEIKSFEEEKAGREIIAEYDRQKHEYRTASAAVDLNPVIAEPKTPVQA